MRGVPCHLWRAKPYPLRQLLDKQNAPKPSDFGAFYY
jgi:hypothetical protein